MGARSLWAHARNPNCDKCEFHKYAKNVCIFGNGPVPSKGMIVGEAPDATSDNVSRAFVGGNGEYLESVLYDLDLNRDDFYVTNATKCKPPRSGKEDFLREAVQACEPYLEQEIAAVQPKAILAMGNFAYYFFAHKTGITKSRGKEFWSDKYNCLIVPTVHPSFVFINPDYHEAFVADIIKFKNIIVEKEPPPVEIVEIHTEEDWAKAYKELMEKPDAILTFDFETRGLLDYKPDFSKAWCVGLSRLGNKAYLLPLEHPESPFLENPDPDWEANWKLNWPNITYRIAPQYHYIVDQVCDLIMRAKQNNHNVKFDLRHTIHLAKRYGFGDKYLEPTGVLRKEFCL